MQAKELRQAIERELQGNLLPFWRERSPDHERGGFIAEMAVDGIVRDGAPRGLILNSRLLWTFSALYRRFGEQRDLELARRAFDILESRFRDREHGGYFWRIDASGKPLDRTKKTYGQAFCIYALSEFHLATGESAALESALELFELVEGHAHDQEFGGYLEARDTDWSETPDLQLSDRDMIAAKSMNTHLHLLEAYTNLVLAIIDPRVVMRLDELIGIFGRQIIHREAGGFHLDHFFDEAWTLQSENRTYGHDIESAWLLSEAAAVLRGEELGETVKLWAIELARSTLAEGLLADGGLAYEGRDGSVTDAIHDWWCQAEAVVGFWHVYTLTGDRAYADASTRVWQFIEQHQADRDGGEWFWRVRADGTIDETEPKVSEWKGPYHTVRMCLEMLRRLDYSDRGDEP
ncbi:MAG: AGE family epimerase/isomerase [Acidobacteriota bacterium]